MQQTPSTWFKKGECVFVSFAEIDALLDRVQPIFDWLNEEIEEIDGVMVDIDDEVMRKRLES